MAGRRGAAAGRRPPSGRGFYPDAGAPSGRPRGGSAGGWEPAFAPLCRNPGAAQNEELLVDVCESLWDEGLRFGLDLAGCTNPHFGRALAARIRGLARRRPELRSHGPVDDDGLARLYEGARAGALPTIAEGCGLPLLESLWMGVPVVCSDIPALVEGASGGGCLTLPVGDRSAWKDGLRRILTDDGLHSRLASEAGSRPLPTWADAARTVSAALAA